jgi:hypothetical protein
MGNAVKYGQAAGQAARGRIDWLDRLFPAVLVRPGLPPRLVQSVLVRTLPLTEPAKAALVMAGRGGAPLDVRLSPEVFLQRDLTVPQAARKDAGEVVALHLRQSMPGQAEGLIWRHVRGPGATVKVFILKQARLDELLCLPDVTLRRVVIDGEDALPLHDARAVTDRMQGLWNRAALAMAAGALALVLAVQGVQVMRAEGAVAAADARIAALREEAIAARSAAEERSARSAAQMADAARLMRESRRLTLLAGLRQALGEGDSLTSFALDGSVLRLAGVTAGDVAATVATIRALGWVEEVELDGAVATEAGSGNRRFQLRILLKTETGE